MVRTVFLHDFHLHQVAFGEGQFAFFTQRNQVCDGVLPVEHAGAEQETARLRCGNVGGQAQGGEVIAEAAEELLVLDERDDVHKVDSLDGEVRIEFDVLAVIHIILLNSCLSGCSGGHIP